MQEKIETKKKIPIEQVEKIIYVSIEYVEATCYNLILAKMWQKLESIESFAKK